MENYSCDVIKDLLPSYVDGLTSEASNAIIRAHLESCPDCKKTYNSMSDGESPSTTSGASSAPSNPSRKESFRIDEAEVMRKINRKLKRKTALNVSIGVVVGVIILALVLLAFPLNKKLAKDQYTVSYENYDMREFADYTYDYTLDEVVGIKDSVSVYDKSKNPDDCKFVKVNIPGYQETLMVDKDFLNANPYVSVIGISSAYYISSYDEEVVTSADGTAKIHVKSVKTPLYGNKEGAAGTKQTHTYLGERYYQVSTIEFAYIEGVE